MILSAALVSIGVFCVLWRRGLMAGLIGTQLVVFGLAVFAVVAAGHNGKPELGSWYALALIVGGLVGSSIGFALAARRLRSDAGRGEP